MVGLLLTGEDVRVGLGFPPPMSKLLFKEYRDLIKNGKKIYSRFYLFYYTVRIPNEIKVSAKRKIGNAVKRNYEKRVLRNILNNLSFKNSVFILAICLQPSELTYPEKEALVKRTLRPLLAPAA